VYFIVLWLFGIFLPVLVCCTKKNLATLIDKEKYQIVQSSLIATFET
jgi:ABC-type enterochelin transport system permease subunit